MKTKETIDREIREVRSALQKLEEIQREQEQTERAERLDKLKPLATRLYQIFDTGDRDGSWHYEGDRWTGSYSTHARWLGKVDELLSEKGRPKMTIELLTNICDYVEEGTKKFGPEWVWIIRHKLNP